MSAHPPTGSPSTGRRACAALAALALGGGVLTGLASPASAADPAAKTVDAASANATAPAFSTSFEDGQPQPAVSTVEVGADGPRQQNVSGSAASNGSLLPLVTDVTASEENAPGEVAANLADANPDSKWLAFTDSATIDYTLSSAAEAVTYSLTSANDSPERDPSAVTLQGSTDGGDWATLDSRSGIDFATRFATQTFEVTTPGSFDRYRLVIDANHSGGISQLADWDLSDGTTGEGSTTPMVTQVGSGPISGFNIKPLVGWTGTKAMRYAGGHTADGRGFAWNRLYDVSIPVAQDTRLGYKIFPDMIAGDLEYPSTYAAVDVHFTDGTYLSDLRATDEHGTPASPSGQGVGKILYANQWNDVSIAVGVVAAGKTADRILLGYDNTGLSEGLAPTDETRFGGWLDDLVVDAGAPLDTSDLSALVDTRRGTNSSGGFSRGNNLPISGLPNGFTFMTPQTDSNSQSWQYYWQAGNNAANQPVMQGLGISHEPSPWMGDRNQLSIMPSIASGTPTGDAEGRGLAFDHATEVARPDYYRAELDGGIKAEMTPADHGGIFRFTFPKDETAGHLVLDTVDDNGSFTIDQAAGTVNGWVDNGSGLSAGRSRMFVYGTFDRPATASGVAPDGHDGTRYVTFDTSSRHQVVLRLSTSFISLGQAQLNHGQEIARGFDLVRADAQKAWNDRLGVMRVEGATNTDLRTLYGSLYRLNLYPNSQFENTGSKAKPRYQYASPVADRSGSPTATRTNAPVKDGKIYVNNGFWDTYRTVWPAYTLLYPEVAAEIADGFVQQYRDGGWVARWSSPGYADLMTGTSSDVAFADAYVKGVKLPDAMGTYAAALKNATVLPTSNAVGRKGLDTSQYLGYTSSSTSESISWGLEGFINDFGIGNMAEALAKDPSTSQAERKQLREESEYLLERSTHYVNSFNPETGFFQGKTAAGAFADDFDPESWGGDFTETNGWNFAFHAPQDGKGLAALYGGREGLATKLDEFFATPETALKPGSYGGTIHEMLEARDVRMGQLGQSNQVSHHIAYMYDWTGQQWKTAEKVREIMRRLYVGSEIGQGYAGDEDNGEMSAWYILSSLGVYPLQVGSAQWAVGSPKFTKATVRRAEGDLVVNAAANSEQNIYVKRLAVNGVDTRSVSIDDKLLSGKSQLDFTMAGQKSSFGSRNGDLPPSQSGGNAAKPLKDASGIGTVTAAGLAEGMTAKSLADNTSRTAATFRTPTPQVAWTLPTQQRVTWYTLTNGPLAGDPSGWRLQGSKDGTTWATLDSRKDQTFPWRTQLRPFKVAKPGAYSRYRLVVTATTGAPAPSLAEVELLTDGTKNGANPLALTPAEEGSTIEGAEWTGRLATVSGGAKSAPLPTASIDWGDGTTSEGTVVAGDLGTASVRGTHAWDEPGYHQVTVTATGDGEAVSASTGVVVHQAVVPSYATGFDSACIGNVGTQVACDGNRGGIGAEALADAGAAPGTLLTVPGTELRYAMPATTIGEPDNATGAGQTLPVTLAPGARHLSLIGTATERDQDTEATVTFDDGTTAAYPVQFGDWCGAAKFGNTIAVEMAYRLSGTATDGCRVKLFATAPLEIPEGRTVASITLPTQTGAPTSTGRIHVFAVADDGQPLAVETADPSDAGVGEAVTVELGTATGGIPAEDGYAARVQWGDGSMVQDAVLAPGADGAVTLSGSHTWAAAGTYTVTVLTGDSRADVVTKVTVTVR